MEDVIKEFLQRWNKVEDATLSSLRGQLKNGDLGIYEPNRVFRDMSMEWIDGNLAPFLWFQSLKEDSPEKAESFKNYVERSEIKQEKLHRPNAIWVTIISLIIAIILYLILSICNKKPDVTINFWIRFVSSVIVYMIFKLILSPIAEKRDKQFIDSTIDLYRLQLTRHRDSLVKILQQ